METFIQIVVSSMDWMKTNQYILSATTEGFMLPISPLEGSEEPEAVAREMFGRFIDVDPNWASFKLLSARRDESIAARSNVLVITYGVVIPYESGVKSGHWVNSNSLDAQFSYREEVHSTLALI